MIDAADFEQIGFIGKAHGIKGEVAAQLQVELCAPEEGEEPLFLMLEINKLFVPYKLMGCRPKGDATLIKFDRVDNAEEAAILQGLPVWIAKEILQDVDDEQIADWAFFTGYTLLDSQKQPIGIIEDIEDTTANELFLVRSAQDKEYLIPIAAELILGIDRKHQTLEMDIPDGLLDI